MARCCNLQRERERETKLYWQLVCLFLVEGNIEILWMVAVNCGAVPPAKQQIHAVHTSYIHFPCPDKWYFYRHCGLMANVVLCDSWGLCVFVFVCVLLVWFKTFLTVFHIFTGLLYVTVHWKCWVMSDYFVVLSKLLRWRHSFHNSPPAMVHSQQRLLFQPRLFHLTFMMPNDWHLAWFSAGTFHSLVSIRTLMLRTHTMTTVNAT
jgi:hypothetical protein